MNKDDDKNVFFARWHSSMVVYPISSVQCSACIVDEVFPLVPYTITFIIRKFLASPEHSLSVCDCQEEMKVKALGILYSSYVNHCAALRYPGTDPIDFFHGSSDSKTI